MFKKHMTPIGKKGSLVTNRGKGAVEQALPSPSAVQTLTGGDPMQRTMNNYAKATPMANPNVSAPDILGGGTGS